MCVLFCGHVFMDVHAYARRQTCACVYTRVQRSKVDVGVFLYCYIHLGFLRQALSLRPELTDLIRLAVHWVPGILLSLPAQCQELCIRWCLAFLSSFLKTRMLISKHKSSGCVASILLIVTSLLWFLPMLINLAGSLLWFLPTTIHSVCSWTSHKWNQTIYTFISDFPIHRFLPLIHVAARIHRLWLFLSKW